MSFIKKDVNFGLLFLLVILAVAITLIGIYYNQNYATLKSDFDKKADNFQKVTDELMYHKTILNKTAQDLQTKEQDENELNSKYIQLRDAKEKLDAENAQLKAELTSKSLDLAQKTTELFNANKQITVMQSDISSLNKQVTLLQNKVSSLNNHIEKVCNGDNSYCD